MFRIIWYVFWHISGAPGLPGMPTCVSIWVEEVACGNHRRKDSDYPEIIQILLLLLALRIINGIWALQIVITIIVVAVRAASMDRRHNDEEEDYSSSSSNLRYVRGRYKHYTGIPSTWPGTSGLLRSIVRSRVDTFPDDNDGECGL